ncbi:hypothetical protein L1049_004526 [Liquidambar formosana]|uniref:asparagine--tRNA ligase n=1 Tax=Liquidambar formosana TaxID=63359 RepID=A0AAP0RPM4_LIQFO
MASEENNTVATPVAPFKYSNRVILKTILGRDDSGLGLVGQKFVIGGWVKSSREVRKEHEPSPSDDGVALTGQKDVSCAEILQSRIPFFRSIMRVLGASNYPVREKLGSVISKPPLPSVAYLQVSDGSCVASLQVLVDSAISPLSQLMLAGTCILAEGVLKQPSVPGKYVIQLEVEKILYVGMVDQNNYPLSKKRIPLGTLRDCSHLRPRTTTVASVMRICNALTFATHTFFHNHGFLYVQVPTITTTDSEGFSEKFHVTTLFSTADKKEPNAIADWGVSLEAVQAAIKEKSNVVEELKRSESNKEALVAAVQDLRKTNELASQLEARGKSTLGTSLKADKADFSNEFFSRPSYLTVSGHLHLESYACALGNVYSFGPRFRADKSESAKHVAEMWKVELEMAFSQLEDVMNCADDYLKFLCKWVLEKCSDDMKFVSNRIEKTIVDRLQSMTSSSFEKISYTKAVEDLKVVTVKTFEVKIDWGVALTEEHVSYLADEIYKKPVIIYDYPKEIKPFYVRLNGDGRTVAAFDMVVPMVGTLISGSQNEERIDMLNTRIKELGLPTEQYEWYLDLRRHGTVKHSGFSLGFDAMVLLATGLTNVRDVIPFPRSHGKANN